MFVSDIAVFVLKRDAKLKLTNSYVFLCACLYVVVLVAVDGVVLCIVLFVTVSFQPLRLHFK